MTTKNMHELKMGKCVACKKELLGREVGTDSPKFLCEKDLDSWDLIQGASNRS